MNPQSRTAPAVPPARRASGAPTRPSLLVTGLMLYVGRPVDAVLRWLGVLK